MSERCLIDTSVLSLVLKRDTWAVPYHRHPSGRVGVLSFITLAELYRWPEERDRGPRRRADLARFLEPFDVVFPDDALCRRWAVLVAQARMDGRPLPFADSWIAATALQQQVPIVTHNPGDFLGIDGLTVISEAPVPQS